MGGARAGELTKENSKYISPSETSQDPRFATEVSTSIKLEFRTLQIGHAEEESINRRNAHFGAICRKNICEKTATAYACDHSTWTGRFAGGLSGSINQSKRGVIAFRLLFNI